MKAFLAVTAISVVLAQIALGLLGLFANGEDKVSIRHGDYTFSPSVGCSFGQVWFGFYVSKDMDPPRTRRGLSLRWTNNMEWRRRQFRVEWWRIVRVDAYADSRYRRLDVGFIFADLIWFGLCSLEGIALAVWFRRQYRKRQQRRRGFLVRSD
jgi:hypothetical protein